MTTRRKVCLYGDSVILGSLGYALRRYPQFEVITLPQSLEKMDIEAVEPDVIFFDLNCPRPQAAFSLLESHPGVTLIGLSPDKNYAHVWSGRQLRELSTRDLLETIGANTDCICHENQT